MDEVEGEVNMAGALLVDGDELGRTRVRFGDRDTENTTVS